MATETTPVLKAGCLAFWDTFSGLVPCKVISVSRTSHVAVSTCEVEFVLTADHGPYKKGEEFTRSSLWVCPRKAIRRGQYYATIGHYTTEQS